MNLLIVLLGPGPDVQGTTLPSLERTGERKSGLMTCCSQWRGERIYWWLQPGTKTWNFLSVSLNFCPSRCKKLLMLVFLHKTYIKYRRLSLIGRFPSKAKAKEMGSNYWFNSFILLMETCLIIRALFWLGFIYQNKVVFSFVSIYSLYNH